MPELPEVEAVARTLRPLVRGQRIRCVHILHPIALKPQAPREFVDRVESRRIKDVARHGKYLFLETDAAWIEMHFRFDGQLIWFANVAAMERKLASGEARVDVALEFDRGVLAFADRRHFGRVHAWDSKAECKPLKSLGTDALSKEFTVRALRERLARSRRPLKDFLLDQSRFAGIGNIYSCEAMWHARLDPRRPANSIPREEAGRLHKAIVSVLRRALECCLDPAPDFQDASWWFQGLERILRVYQREGLACRRCGSPIQRIEQSGRSTYCCKTCQK